MTDKHADRMQDKHADRMQDKITDKQKVLSVDSCHSLIRSLFTSWKDYKHIILEEI